MLRGIEELATENISYTVEKTGNVYDFNTAEELNQLLIKLLLATGQLTEGGEYDVDFDHQFLEVLHFLAKGDQPIVLVLAREMYISDPALLCKNVQS